MKDIIIIEGTDGVGKSTIVNLLIELGYKSLHFDYDPSLSIKEKYNEILSTDFGTSVVLDRSFVSEMVYGPILRGHSRLSDSDFSDLLSKLHQRNGKVILLDADPKIIHDRIKKRDLAEDRHTTIEELAGIRNTYLALLEGRNECRIDIINNNFNLPQDVLSLINSKEPQLKCLIFDFDETIYHPKECDLADQILHRMVGFISEKFNLSYKEARALSGSYRTQYGSTVVGLAENHKIPPEEFLEHSYDLDLSALREKRDLAKVLADIPERKIILTNASEKYVEKALEIMGLRGFFESIVGIYKTNYVPKPQYSAFKTAVNDVGLSGINCAMFDDQPINLEMAKKFGMRTVLCNSDEAYPPQADFIVKHLDKELPLVVKKLRQHHR